MSLLALQGCYTIYHKFGGLKEKNIFSHDFWNYGCFFWRFLKLRCQQGQALSKGSLGLFHLLVAPVAAWLKEAYHQSLLLHSHSLHLLGLCVLNLILTSLIWTLLTESRAHSKYRKSHLEIFCGSFVDNYIHNDLIQSYVTKYSHIHSQIFIFTHSQS